MYVGARVWAVGLVVALGRLGGWWLLAWGFSMHVGALILPVVCVGQPENGAKLVRWALNVSFQALSP